MVKGNYPACALLLMGFFVVTAGAPCIDSLNSAGSSSSLWCGEQDLNLHAFRQQLLRLPRLPIPPSPHAAILKQSGLPVARTSQVELERQSIL